MKRILTIKAEEGMVVAGDVYTDNNHLVISRGTVLDKDIIERLKYYSVFDFFIEDDKPVKLSSYNQDDLERMIFQEYHIETGSYYQKIKESAEFEIFERMFQDSVSNIRSCINDVVTKNEDVKVDELLQSVKKITDDFRPDVSLFDMLHCIEGYDDLTYIHSVNVALICRIIGIWMGYSEDECDVLTICGLFHDIGKVMIPVEVIAKPGRLTATEYALVQTHTIHGYNLLKEMNLDERVKLAALQHHEKCDGKGYPSKYRYNDIEPFARIVAIADVYDAMTSNRIYRKGICPFEVISIFEENIDAYDPKVLFVFLEKIAHSYVNTDVILNDDMEGKIVMINKYALGRPGVLVGGAYVDLARQDNMQITALK